MQSGRKHTNTRRYKVRKRQHTLKRAVAGQIEWNFGKLTQQLSSTCISRTACVRSGKHDSSPPLFMSVQHTSVCSLQFELQSLRYARSLATPRHGKYVCTHVRVCVQLLICNQTVSHAWRSSCLCLMSPQRVYGLSAATYLVVSVPTGNLMVEWQILLLLQNCQSL